MTVEENFVYGHVMDALSGDLYHNKLDVLREYLQNSYDAIKEYVFSSDNEDIQLKRMNTSKIDIKIDSNSIYIFDNAIGMNLQILNEYRKIGFSRKTKGTYAGWRGIGKAAGLAVAEMVYVNTSNGEGKGYQLVFKAKELRDAILNAKKTGINLPLDGLIKNCSDIKEFDEVVGNHYTMVELHNITGDSKELLDANKVIAYLSLIAPLHFNPNFEYANEIEEQLYFYVEDYLPMNLFVNGEQVYKPYLHEWVGESETAKIKPPKTKEIYDNENNLIAFCWFCMNSGKGQITEKMKIANSFVHVKGLYLRVHNIRIGDEQLTRKYLWYASPERSFYALGEIHVLDDKVDPTSGRNDFVDNHARYQFIHKCAPIVADINYLAQEHSNKLRSKAVINKKAIEINEIATKVENKAIPKNLVSEYIYRTQDVKHEAEKRKKATSEKAVQNKADNIIKKANIVLNKLETSLREPTVPENKVYKDILDEIKLTDEAKLVYENIINVLKNYFVNDPNILEEILIRIDNALTDAFSS